MELTYERINKDNIRLASIIQYEIFPNSSAYTKYLKQINGDKKVSVDYLVYCKLNPIGIIGLYEQDGDDESIWLSYFGLLKQYRKKGYGKRMLNDVIELAKRYNKKYLRLYTYEVWNSVAQDFYKKHMQLEEYYINKNDNQIDILEGKPKIFSYSLTGDKIKPWNNKYIGLNTDDKEHFKSVELMIKDRIIKEDKNGNNR